MKTAVTQVASSSFEDKQPDVTPNDEITHNFNSNSKENWNEKAEHCERKEKQ